ncbi:ribosome maturation factor RimM [Viridibacillus sp. FSL R5-0477]|uniref:Ribosome maturation factor RimM n=1 Tax=Viridibacillus arenosi FSL R5-213 TaxID=1227360 RepID=W4EYZ5_9BACL|nr:MULTISPECIES: ribosome maturation factor RimM [Viridibacillus]ETT85833.1 16S rRNA-processing protein [Viridibacillus arenosi FSL R5-213]OMC82913.1 ribosome maturation factor RimM [Viridibacillus sp. FSL H8-0123]OMC88831.1 ribosome maturation factor RimM [Viridibacillus sp. FSL H7-0596]OMC93460.1 ribosome maturation factor RimM [Viridibacillus arenosi]
MEWYNVGKIVNTHGIRGEVRVISQTDFPEERYVVGEQIALFKKDSKKPLRLTIASARAHKNFILLTFEGYPNINDVEDFRDGILKVSEKQLSELADDEYYYHEIIGCTVFDEEGTEIGQVKEIFETGANDVWTLKGVNGKDQYIPVIDDVIKEIDVDEKKIIIHVMDGLLS